jgi:hypothetical protein
MPRTLPGIVGFLFTATVIFVVGGFVWNRFAAPAVAKLMNKAA